MNVRGISMCLLCAGALFVACGSKRGKTVEVAEQADTVHVVGGDRISMVALHLPDIPGVRFRKTVSVCGKKESV